MTHNDTWYWLVKGVHLLVHVRLFAVGCNAVDGLNYKQYESLFSCCGPNNLRTLQSQESATPELDKYSRIIYFAYEIFQLKIIICPYILKRKG